MRFFGGSLFDISSSQTSFTAAFFSSSAPSGAPNADSTALLTSFCVAFSSSCLMVYSLLSGWLNDLAFTDVAT